MEISLWGKNNVEVTRGTLCWETKGKLCFHYMLLSRTSKGPHIGLMPVISATWATEIGKITARGQTREKD
jgi:hypothetical protein